MERARAGDRFALARALTLAEQGLAVPGVAGGVLNAHVVGVTGSPGAGKSTFVGRLALRLRRMGRRVGILAVDPTSPFSGGAVLGDRLRMELAHDDPGLFMRSVASRGHQGGLAPGVFGMVRVLDAAGMDVVLVETVGAGQNDVGVLGVAETVLLLVNPSSGDEIQAMKAGIIEIGDVVVVHKADLPGAGEAFRAVTAALRLGQRPSPEEGWWDVVVLLASSHAGTGLDDVVTALDRHRAHVRSQRSGEQRRLTRAAWELRAALQAAIDREFVAPARQEGAWGRLVRALAEGRMDAHEAAQVILHAARVPAHARDGA